MYCISPFGEHVADIFAATEPLADLARRVRIQRCAFEEGDSSSEVGQRLSGTGIDEDRIVVDDFAVLFPFEQLRHKVVAHQDRESHLRTVVLRQVTQGVDRVRRFVEHEFDDRRFDLVGIFRCGACGFRHREAIQLRSLLSGGLERVLRRNHQYDFVAESFFDRIFGQRDVALVDRIEGPEVEHYVFHGIVCFVVYFFPFGSGRAGNDPRRAPEQVRSHIRRILSAFYLQVSYRARKFREDAGRLLDGLGKVVVDDHMVEFGSFGEFELRLGYSAFDGFGRIGAPLDEPLAQSFDGREA